MSTETSVAAIEQAMEDLRVASRARLEAEDAVTTLERDYETWKIEQTVALVGTENPLTNKPHSHTSAKDGIKDLPEYGRWTVEVDRARARSLAARMLYEVSLEAVRSARVVAMVEAGVAA